MPYAFIQDVPADEPAYREIRALLGDEPPEGLITHVVVQQDSGLRYIDVWSSREHWESFRDAHVEPAVRAVLSQRGVPQDHSLVRFEPITVLDVWSGDRAAEARP